MLQVNHVKERWTQALLKTDCLRHWPAPSYYINTAVVFLKVTYHKLHCRNISTTNSTDGRRRLYKAGWVIGNITPMQKKYYSLKGLSEDFWTDLIYEQMNHAERLTQRDISLNQSDRCIGSWITIRLAVLNEPSLGSFLYDSVQICRFFSDVFFFHSWGNFSSSGHTDSKLLPAFSRDFNVPVEVMKLLHGRESLKQTSPQNKHILPPIFH